MTVTSARSPLPQTRSPRPFQPIAAPLHKHRKSRRTYYLSLCSEASLKIFINGLFLSAFAVALARLVPEMLRNHHQQMGIEAELTHTENRVDRLKQQFMQTFSPDSSINIIEAQSYQVDPQKQRIVFVQKAANPSQSPEQTSGSEATKQ